MLFKKYRRIFIVTFLLLSIIVGCVPVPKETIAEERPMQSICSDQWDDIIPGETTKLEALMALESRPFVDQKSIRVFEVDDHTERLEWKQSGTIPSRSRGDILIVDDIVVSVGTPLLGDITLGRWIEACGEPNQVRASRDGESPFVWLELFYPQEGWLILARQKTFNDEKTSILADARVLEVEYFIPVSLPDYLKNIRLIKNEAVREEIRNQFYPWPGIGAYIDVSPY